MMRNITTVKGKWRKGWSLNDVTTLEGQEFCDDSTLPLVIKSVTRMGRGKKKPKLCDVIFQRSQNTIRLRTCDDINEPENVEYEVEFAEVKFHLLALCS